MGERRAKGERLENPYSLYRDGLECGLALEVEDPVHLVHGHGGGQVALVELEDVGDALEVETVLGEVVLQVSQ